jgi:NtrC-family two-component system sensor histidine kinase KinB
VKLRSKLLLAQLPLVTALLLIGTAGSRVTSALGQASDNILRDNYRSVLAAQRMKESLERIDSAALFFIAGQPADASAHKKRFEDELHVQESNITEAGEHEATERLRALWHDYDGAWSALATQGDPKRYYFDALLPRFTAVKDAADGILAMNQDAMVRKSEATQRTSRRLDTLLLALVLGGCVLGLLASTTLTARLLRPLSVLGQASRRIGDGDLVARARIEGKDELAQLAKEFNTMADRLQKYRESSLGELLEAQQGFQAAIDSLPDPVLVISNEGGLLQVNQAAESVLKIDLEHGGGSGEALRGVDPIARDAVERARQHVASGKGAVTPKGLEDAFRLGTAEGERHFLTRAAPVYGEGGSVVGTTVVLQDVTRLLRFDELKNNLVATVAHEFRTPLTSLQMAIHLCLEQTVGPLTEKQADLLYAARDDCSRLQSIVEELLDLSRIQSGRVELHRQPLDAERLVREITEAHEAEARARNVALKIEVLPGTGRIDADPERLELVFDNLLSNAIRHSKSGSEVAVRATAHERDMKFTVVDQGPGVPHEYQQAIFEKFFRMPGAPEGGAGLGLFIARELVQAHGGEIGVESKPGQGAAFWFTVPLAG